MPLDLIEIDLEKRILCPGDRGFFISAKNRYQKTLRTHALKWLKHYTERYFEAKCPEEAAALKAEEEKEKAEKESEEPSNGVKEEIKEDVKEEIKEDVKEEQVKEEKEEVMEEGGDEEKKEEEEVEVEETVDSSGILFAEREMVYESCYFIACNLEDPGDFLHFIYSTMAENYSSEKKPKFPMRVVPVSVVCEARPKTLENMINPQMEKIFGAEDLRFSIQFSFKKRSVESEHLSAKEAMSIVRNCIWAVNPNSVQCIKYQDYAIVMDYLDPLYLIGVAKDFNMLGSYVTSGMRNGYHVHDTDSEDDISDDPDIDEEENRRRILRIKRKRRAEKAGLNQPSENGKKDQEGEDEDGEDEGGHEDDHGDEEGGGEDNE